MKEGRLRTKTLPNHQRAPSGQQRALKDLQRALSLRRTGDDFKIDRESSQDGIGPHRLTEGLPDQARDDSGREVPLKANGAICGRGILRTSALAAFLQ